MKKIFILCILFLSLVGLLISSCIGLKSGQYETIEITVPVDIQDATGVGSLYFEMTYDEGESRAVEVKTGTQADNAMLEYSIDVPGRVIIGIIDSVGISGDGSVATIKLEAQSDDSLIIPLGLEYVVARDTATTSEIITTTLPGRIVIKDGSFTAPTIIFKGTVEK